MPSQVGVPYQNLEGIASTPTSESNMDAHHNNRRETVVIYCLLTLMFVCVSVNSVVHTVLSNLYLKTWYCGIICAKKNKKKKKNGVANSGRVYLGFLTSLLEHGQLGCSTSAGQSHTVTTSGCKNNLSLLQHKFFSLNMPFHSKRCQIRVNGLQMLFHVDFKLTMHSTDSKSQSTRWLMTERRCKTFFFSKPQEQIIKSIHIKHNV